LIKTYAVFHIQNSDGLEQPQSTEAISIRRAFRRFERYLHMTLGGKVVNLIRLRLLDDPNEVGSVRHVPVVHDKAQLLLVRILIKMIDPPGIERGRAPLQAMNDIALVEQEFGKVRAILPGDSGNPVQLALP
jgi:hypothetical protein